MTNLHLPQSERRRGLNSELHGFAAGLVRENADEKTSNAALLDGIRLSIYPSLEASEALWKKAETDCACYAFQSFTWLSTWQETIGRAQGIVPLIVHLSDCTGRTLMILPLGIYRRGRLRILQFLGGGITDYHAPIIDRAFAARVGAVEFATLWKSVLKRLPPVDIVWIWHMPETIEGARNPMLALPGAAFLENAYAAALPPSFDEFKAGKSQDFFKDTRRRLRRLSKNGQTEIALPRDASEAVAWVRIMARQKSRRWRESGAADIFQQPEYLAFYEALTRTWFETDNVHVCCLRVDGTVIATDWGLVYNRRFYSMMAGYEEEWAQYSPGRILLESVVEWCIGEPSVEIFDLTVGGEAYKKYWSDHSLAIYECLAAQSLKGLAAVTTERLKRRLLRNSQIRAVRRWMKGIPQANGAQSSASA